MKKWMYILLFAATALSAVSCIYDFDPDVYSDGAGIRIFEGNILAGDYTEIVVSKTVALNDTVYDWSKNSIMNDYSLKMYIECEDGTVIDNEGYGYYKFDTRNIDPSKRYRLVALGADRTNGTTPSWVFDPLLSFGYKKLRYESPWLEVLDSAPIDSLSYEIKGPDKISFRVTSSAGSTHYFYWRGRETWEFTAQLYTLDRYNVREKAIMQYPNGENRYYCWQDSNLPFLMTTSSEMNEGEKLVNYEIYSYGNNERKLSYLYSVEIIQECIPEESYRYYETMHRNNTDVGGLFSPQPSAVRGNILNMEDTLEYVVGYISASKVSKSRIFYDNLKERFCKYRDAPLPEPTILGRSEWAWGHGQGLGPYAPYYNPDGYSPPDAYEWYPVRCLDCTKNGGHKIKPDYWPNDHT